MTVFMQLFWGSVLLSVCSLLHVLCLVGTADLLARISFRLHELPSGVHSIFLIGGAIFGLVFAHTIEVWIWALSLVWLGAMPSIAESVYFALVTYTTVGYGDIVLGPDFRIFGAMSAVTGLLAFGMSTAFLVAVLGRLFPNARFP